MFKLILIPIFFFDRIISVFLFWENTYKFSVWERNEVFVLESIKRCMFFCVFMAVLSILINIE